MVVSDPARSSALRPTGSFSKPGGNDSARDYFSTRGNRSALRMDGCLSMPGQRAATTRTDGYLHARASSAPRMDRCLSIPGQSAASRINGARFAQLVHHGN